MSLLDDAKRLADQNRVNTKAQIDKEEAIKVEKRAKIQRLCQHVIIEILKLIGDIKYKSEVGYEQIHSTDQLFLLQNQVVKSFIKDGLQIYKKHIWVHTISILQYKIIKIYITLKDSNEVVIGFREDFGNLSYNQVNFWHHSDNIKTDIRQKLVNLISKQL